MPSHQSLPFLLAAILWRTRVITECVCKPRCDWLDWFLYVSFLVSYLVRHSVRNSWWRHRWRDVTIRILRVALTFSRFTISRCALNLSRFIIYFQVSWVITPVTLTSLIDLKVILYQDGIKHHYHSLVLWYFICVCNLYRSLKITTVNVEKNLSKKIYHWLGVSALTMQWNDK